MFRQLFLFVALVIISTIGMCNVTNAEPIRSSTNEIREKLLHNTPLGISMDQVVAYCQSKKIPYTLSSRTGYLDQDRHVVVGSQFIRGELGDYTAGILVTASVSVFWGFDEQGKLIQIWIWKTFDSL